jgi:hypothetical protein
LAHEQEEGEIKMQYGTLLSRAWHITWRNKIIWLFGFLAALGSGGGGGGNFNYRFGSGDLSRSGGTGLPPELQRQLTRFLSDQTLVITVIVIIALIGLVIGLVLALLAALSHSAMVDMVREADETEATRFNTGWRTGLRRMLPTFLIRFLLGLPSFIIIMAGLAAFLASFIPLINQTGFRDAERLFAGGMLATLFLCFLPACCLGILLDIPLRVLETLSIRALVLEDRGVLGSIRRGWNILTGNLGDVVVVWLIFFLLGIGVAVVVGLPLTAIAFAALFPLALMAATSPIFVVPLVLVGLLLGLLSAAIRSVVEAYSSSVWTLAYRQFIARSVTVTTTN